MAATGDGAGASRFFGEIAKLVQAGVARVSDDYVGTAALYDIVERHSADIPFYLRAARRLGGEVLELGCGTGRVLVPLAEAGIKITGLDLAPDMLAICRAKLATSAAATANATLIEGDMRDFDLGRRFSLVICPYYTFIHLRTYGDKLAAFERAAAHLVPGGRLLIEAELSSGFVASDAPVLNVARHDRRTGETLLVLQQARHEPGGVLVNLLYIGIDASGTARLTAVSSRESRTTVSELADLATEAGLRVEGVWGDYAGGELADEARGVVFAAVCPAAGLPARPMEQV